MLERVGASVELSCDHRLVQEADALFVPGVGNFHACMRGLRAVDGPRMIDVRLAGGRPVMGICVGMQVLFDGSTEVSVDGQEPGLGEWPGVVERLVAPIVPHMGWSGVKAAEGTRLFAGVQDERFYFVHSYAALSWELEPEGSMPWWRPGSAGPSMGHRSWQPWRMGRWWPHSSTPRSQGTPGPTSWRAGSRPYEDC